jgi:hypothetical protein
VIRRFFDVLEVVRNCFYDLVLLELTEERRRKPHLVFWDEVIDKFEELAHPKQVFL